MVNDLDDFLEYNFIPSYIKIRKRKTSSGKIEYFPIIELKHILSLKLNKNKIEYVMNYLKENNIYVVGSVYYQDGNFNNREDKEELPLTIPSEDILKKIILYKENHNENLRNEIITDNIRLVRYVSYKYSLATGININELESYGYEGLIIALDNFNLSYNGSFSTYAMTCIKGKILNGIEEIYLGKMDNFYYKYLKAKNEVENKWQIEINEKPELIDEVVELIFLNGFFIKDNKPNREFAKRKVTLLVFGNNNLSKENELIDSCDYEEKVLNKVYNEEVYNLLDTLSETEKKVLELRFGFNDNYSKTLDETAILLGTSREYIRKIQVKSLRKLRNNSILLDKIR